MICVLLERFHDATTTNWKRSIIFSTPSERESQKLHLKTVG